MLSPANAARPGERPARRGRPRRCFPVRARLAATALLAAGTLTAQQPQVLVVRTPTSVPLKFLDKSVKTFVTPVPKPTVPAVEGHPFDDAVRELRRRDFQIVFAGDEQTATYAAGTVARQEPKGGSAVPPGPRVVRIWRSAAPPLVTAAAPTATPTPVDTATPTPIDTPTPVPTATPAREAPSPTPAEAAGAKKRPTRLPPVDRPARPTPTPRPPSNFSWLVVAGLAALAAGAWLALRLRTPDGGKDGPSRAPDVEILPRSDLGTQEIASPQPATSGLTFHAVPDPGEQSLAVNGPLVIEGKT